ncbi:MAG: murein L,D-transpeptidase family protein [Succinivibrionaceae bacterium]
MYLKNFLINKDTSKIITRVVVKKSLYRLFLYQNNILIKTYIIALGKNPVGHKQYEGDQKTPEGKYILDYIKLNSNYYKSFHISYPNANDIKHAESMGRSPGGMIMVHGQPKYTGKKEDFVPGIQASNWTNGCIALLNEDMDEFIQLVKPGTIIEIEP